MTTKFQNRDQTRKASCEIYDTLTATCAFGSTRGEVQSAIDLKRRPRMRSRLLPCQAFRLTRGVARGKELGLRLVPNGQNQLTSSISTRRNGGAMQFEMVVWYNQANRFDPLSASCRPAFRDSPIRAESVVTA
jgi:hypothetical protein